MPTYRYTGDVPTVFTTMRKDGVTWVPSTGDTIDLDSDPGHPWLELVTSSKPAPASETKNTESPAAADESEEN